MRLNRPAGVSGPRLHSILRRAGGIVCLLGLAAPWLAAATDGEIVKLEPFIVEASIQAAFVLRYDVT